MNILVALNLVIAAARSELERDRATHDPQLDELVVHLEEGIEVVKNHREMLVGLMTIPEEPTALPHPGEAICCERSACKKPFEKGDTVFRIVNNQTTMPPHRIYCRECGEAIVTGNPGIPYAATSF